MTRLLKVTLLLAIIVGFGSVAQADTVGTISLTGCGTAGSGCPNATYNFNITTTSATLTITVTGAVNANNNLIQSVNLGFTPSSNISGLNLTASPAGTWTFTTGSIGNSGCGANNGAFVCANNIPGVTIVQGGTYTWIWTYNALDPSVIAGDGNVHVGTNYDPHNGWIVSQEVNVPEPSSLLLLGIGLISLGGISRRKLIR